MKKNALTMTLSRQQPWFVSPRTIQTSLSRQPLAGDAYFKASGFVSEEGDHIKGYSCPFRGYRFVEINVAKFFCPVGAILCDVR